MFCTQKPAYPVGHKFFDICSRKCTTQCITVLETHANVQHLSCLYMVLPMCLLCVGELKLACLPNWQCFSVTIQFTHVIHHCLSGCSDATSPGPPGSRLVLRQHIGRNAPALHAQNHTCRSPFDKDPQDWHKAETSAHAALFCMKRPTLPLSPPPPPSLPSIPLPPDPTRHGLQLEGYKYASDDQKKDLRMRFFHTHQNIHPNHVFQPIVSAPTLEDRKPRVDWTDFHTIVPVGSQDKNHSGRLDELSSLWRTSSEWHAHRRHHHSTQVVITVATAVAVILILLPENSMQICQQLEN